MKFSITNNTSALERHKVVIFGEGGDSVRTSFDEPTHLKKVDLKESSNCFTFFFQCFFIKKFLLVPSHYKGESIIMFGTVNKVSPVRSTTSLFLEVRVSKVFRF